MSKDNFAVIDVAAGPIEAGALRQGDGALSSKRFEGFGAETSGYDLAGRLSAIVRSFVESVVARDVAMAAVRGGCG